MLNCNKCASCKYQNNIRNYKLYVHISPSNKRYYGITGEEKVENRWGKDGSGYDTQYFNRAINKYGWNQIQHLVLFDNLTKEEANLLEQCYIELYDTANPEYGYNISKGGGHHNHTEETRKIMSKNTKELWDNIEYRERQTKAITEGHNTPEWREKMKKVWTNKSEETKRKISENNGKGMLGKHHTEEVRNKISESHKGKTFTEEHRRKLSESHKGKSFKKCKKVKCIELNKIFNNAREASEYLSKKDDANIRSCCRGETKTAYKMHWEYVTEEQEEQVI